MSDYRYRLKKPQLLSGEVEHGGRDVVQVVEEVDTTFLALKELTL